GAARRSLSEEFSGLLARFAEKHGKRMQRLPDWDSLLEEAAVVKILERHSESERDWVTEVKRLARERGVSTVAGLATLQLDRSRYTKTAAFDTVIQNLKAEAVTALKDARSLV